MNLAVLLKKNLAGGGGGGGGDRLMKASHSGISLTFSEARFTGSRSERAIMKILLWGTLGNGVFLHFLGF